MRDRWATKLRQAVRALSCGAAVAALAASCGTPEAAPQFPAVVTGGESHLYPEGVAWDPTRQTFLVGSLGEGTVSEVRPDGTVRTIVDDGVMVSTLGIQVDAAHGRILATYQDPGTGSRTSDKTFARQAGLGIFDLATGALIHRVDLGQKHAENMGGQDSDSADPHGPDDVAVDAAGNAYVTDIAGGSVYRVDPSGHAELLLNNPGLLGRDGVGPNGIAWHPGGYLLMARYNPGAVFRIPVDDPQRVTEVALDQPMSGADGLALLPDGTLTVVTNRLAAQTEPGVTILRSDDDWRSARRVARHEPWPAPDPTTVTATPHGAYVLTGRLTDVFAGHPSAPFEIRRLP